MVFFILAAASSPLAFSAVHTSMIIISAFSGNTIQPELRSRLQLPDGNVHCFLCRFQTGFLQLFRHLIQNRCVRCSILKNLLSTAVKLFSLQNPYPSIVNHLFPLRNFTEILLFSIQFRTELNMCIIYSKMHHGLYHCSFRSGI